MLQPKRLPRDKRGFYPRGSEIKLRDNDKKDQRPWSEDVPISLRQHIMASTSTSNATPAGTSAVAPTSSTTSTNPQVAAPVMSKTVRRNLLYMCSDPAMAKELDRFMIAMFRFQTEGRVRYRQMLGLHGGGGGASDKAYQERMKEKVAKDIAVNRGHTRPTDYFWPDAVPNASREHVESASDSPFTYTFCYHAEPEFIIWHRPYMIEFERELQCWDPAFGESDEDKRKRHEPGPETLGVPYWAWETWDGMTLPRQVTVPTYTVRSDAWKEAGFPQGHILRNPLLQWFAPVSVEDQLNEKFPPFLNSTTSSTRAATFTDPTIPNDLPWMIRPDGAASGNPSMNEVVMKAIAEPNWRYFCTSKKGYGGSTWSIENAHNKFHNHIGGYTMGGVGGNGRQPVPGGDPTEDFFTGTMTSNQSVFDPIFWIHHSNVERQLLSWQRKWFPNGTTQAPLHPESMPDEDRKNKVLLPWTKPSMTAQGQTSINTNTNPDNDSQDGTFWDWFTAEPTYEYEEYLEPLQTSDFKLPLAPMFRLGPTFFTAPKDTNRKRVRLIAAIQRRLRGGEFTVLSDGHPKATVNVLTAVGSGCASCQAKDAFSVDFDATQVLLTYPEDLEGLRNQLILTRNGIPFPHDQVTWSAEYFA